MRANFGATGGGGAEVQADNDTSSSGSSPHSNQDEDIIEVRRGPKPIYNFSIPDVIDHEQHKRKRGYPSRGAYRGSATSKSRKLRKNNEHHVIDLTEDSHDEEDADQQTNNRSWDSELNIGDESFIEALSGIEQFRHRLSQSRERMQHIIRPNYLFRRSLVTDGPTEEVIQHNESRRLHHRDPPTSLDESVVVLDNDREIALQMANDPNFSPTSHTPINRESLRRSTMEQHQRLEANLQRRIYDNRQRLQQLRSGYLRFSPHLTEEERRLRHAQGANDAEMNSPTDVEIIREMPPTSLNEFIQNFTEESLFPVRVNTRSIFPEHFPVSSGLMSNFLETPPRLSHFQDFEALWDLTERIGPAKPRGLSKTEVDSIPSFRFSSGTAKETNKKCVVCLSEYANREKLRRLPCSHDFHSKCIDKWLKSSRTCPVCRDDVQKADVPAAQTTSPLEE